MRRVLLAVVTAPAVAGDAAAIATAPSCSVPGHEDAGMHGTLIVI